MPFKIGKITGKLLIAFVAFAALPLAILSLVADSQVSTVIHRQNLETLRIGVNHSKFAILEFLVYLKGRTLDFSSDGFIRDSLEQINRGEIDERQQLEELNRHLALNKQPLFPESVEVFVLDLNGTVVASSDPSQTGMAHAEARYYLQGQAEVFVSDLFRRQPGGEVSWIVSAPLYSKTSGVLQGVLANRIQPKSLSDITTGREYPEGDSRHTGMRIGKSGETYLVNRERLMITKSRFPYEVVLKQVVETQPVIAAIERNETFVGDYQNYRGVSISGASAMIQETGWILLFEINLAETLAPMWNLRKVMLLLVGVILFSALLVSLFLTLRLTRPIQTIHEANLAVARGDESRTLIPKASIPADEIGQIMHSRIER